MPRKMRTLKAWDWTKLDNGTGIDMTLQEMTKLYMVSQKKWQGKWQDSTKLDKRIARFARIWHCLTKLDKIWQDQTTLDMIPPHLTKLDIFLTGHWTEFDNIWPWMTGFDNAWQNIWQHLTTIGRISQCLTAFVNFRQNIWQDLIVFDNIWHNSTAFGRMFDNVGQDIWRNLTKV